MRVRAVIWRSDGVERVERMTARREGVCWMAEIFWATLVGKSSSWYTSLTVGSLEMMRKYRVSEPAPRDMICFCAPGSAARNLLTSVSMAAVRT